MDLDDLATKLPFWDLYKQEYLARIFKFYHTPRRRKALSSVAFNVPIDETLPDPADKKEEYRLRQYLLYHIIIKKGRTKDQSNTNEFASQSNPQRG
jgi:hypothetical protein